METARITFKKMSHVDNHLTPLAVAVVAPGLFLAPIGRTLTIVGTILLLFSLAVNGTALYYGRQEAGRIGKFRVVSNFVVNIAFLWILYPVWPPVWILLLLMSAGVGAYQGQGRETVLGAIFAGMLLVVHAVFGDHSVLGWAEALTKAVVVFMFSLYVAGLIRLSRG